ncbi:MAG: DUF3341 domain-containing protein [Leptonema sp. (in: bacteria)]
MQLLDNILNSIEKFLDRFFGKQIEFFDNLLLKWFRYSYEEPAKGIYAVFDTPEKLLKSAQILKNNGYTNLDAFTPFPIHGLEYALGYERSRLPYLTFFAGLTGFLFAFFLQYNTHENLISTTITHAIDAYPNLNSYPLDYGGKPTFSWPAMIPICFELTVLFGGLGTVAGLFLLSRMPKSSRMPIEVRSTNDKFVIWIPSNSNHYNEEQIKSTLQQLNPEIIKTVG